MAVKHYRTSYLLILSIFIVPDLSAIMNSLFAFIKKLALHTTDKYLLFVHAIVYKFYAAKVQKKIEIYKILIINLLNFSFLSPNTHKFIKIIVASMQP